MPQTEQDISEGIKWIDVTNPSRDEAAQLSKIYNLGHHIVEDSLQPEHLPKYEVVEDVHFMIIRYFAGTDECQDTIQRLTNKIAIFCGEKFLITIHKSAPAFIDTLRDHYCTAGKAVSSTEIISKIVWNALETFDARVNALSEKVAIYEDEIIQRRTSNDQIEALYIIKRETSLSYKVLVLMQEPINHIVPKPGEEPIVQDVKDQHLKMKTLYSQMLEDINNLMNLSMSFASKKTNDVMKVLTIFSVFFMPLTFIVGVYGMNFKFMPELEKKWGYPGVLILMIIVTLGVYIWFKRKKWL